MAQSNPGSIAAGTSSTATAYAPPTITSLSPATVEAGAAAFTLTINGTNFVSGSTTAKWGSTPLAAKFISAKQLTAPVAAAQIATLGTVKVTVTTPDGSTAPSVFSINPKPPTIASLSPESAEAGSYPVVVTNPAPGGGSSAAASLAVNNPVPTGPLTVSPAVVLTGTTTPTKVTVTGGTSSPLRWLNWEVFPLQRPTLAPHNWHSSLRRLNR